MFKFCQHPLCFNTSKYTVEDLLRCRNMEKHGLSAGDGRTRNSLGSGFSETRIMGQDKSIHSPGVTH